MKISLLSIFSVLILFIFWGCEKEFDNIVDQQKSSYHVSNIFSLTFSYTAEDSSITMRISFSNDDGVSSVFAEIISSDGKKLNKSNIILYDNGNQQNGDITANDKTYSARYPLSSVNPGGTYIINYYVQDVSGKTNKAATQSFEYDNGQANAAPVVSNLVAPDTVTLNTSEKTLIFLSVTVTDENGLNDIERVFFNSFLPDGNPSSNNPFIMFDNGTNGDQSPGDGVYSLIIELPPTGVTLGKYRWEFQAQDRRKFLSNKIIHNIVVK